MKAFAFSSTGELIVSPSATSSRHDFDFLEGNWIIHNKKLKSRLTNSTEWIEFDASQQMRKVLTGTANVENISATINGEVYEGMAIRLFNETSRLWSIYWADNKSGALDSPVIGSFKKEIGTFFGKEVMNGQEILLQFKWDATNKERPAWSQAFSADNGKTWEWNWYMFFERNVHSKVEGKQHDGDIEVLELRNYLMKTGKRAEFIQYFEDNFINIQNQLGGYVLGQYIVKGRGDNFLWMRGFANMCTRYKMLQDFYYSSFWKGHKDVANSMLLNNDNVYLLKPLPISNETTVKRGFNKDWFEKEKGISVIDFYTSNTKLDKLVTFIKTEYTAILESADVKDTSFWVSETTNNEFTQLPVFQDKNLLVQISFYTDEAEYKDKQQHINVALTGEQKANLADLVTLKHTLVTYPTKKSFSINIKE